MRGTPFSALAFYMSKKGLDVTIYHSCKDIFKKDKTIFNDLEFKLMMNEYKSYLDFAIKKGTKVLNGIDINIDLLINKLKEDNLIVLAGKLTGGYHAILLTGYDNNNFKVCAPLYKDKQIRTFEEIENFMDTSIGKWFIAVNE